MPRHYRTLLFTTIAMLAFAGGSSAAVISSQSFTSFGFGKRLGVTEVSLRLTLSQPSAFGCFVPSPTCFVVLDQAITAADIGRTFSFTAADPGFAAISDVLTDGIADDWFFTEFPIDGGGFGPILLGAPNGQPDFQGYVLSGIDVTLNGFISPEIDLAGFVFTDNIVDLTLSVEGSTPTPEPGTILLLATGLGILAVVRVKASRLRESARAGRA